MTSILAQLSVRRGPDALEFYAAAFGAVVDYKVGDTEIVAQLSVGEASFWVSDEAPEHGNFSPETLSGATTRMLLIVEDPDAAVARALEAGATEVSPVSAEDGGGPRPALPPLRPPRGSGRPPSARPPGGARPRKP